jgi:proline racemase
MKDWQPPKHWTRITTIDTHTEGEPFRVITSGFPELKGNSILEKRRYVKSHFDHLRTALMWEPRGHADMYGCIVTPPVSDGADFGVLFLHNEGFSTMCGHGIIGITKVAVETGLVKLKSPETTVVIDTPAGRIISHARVREGFVRKVRFENVPSFVLSLNDTIEIPGIGNIRYDIAYGGAFYAFVRVDDVGLQTVPEDTTKLIEKGMAIKRAIMASRSVVHPFEKDLSFLYGTIFVGPPKSARAHSSNVCIFAEGEVDRSPTGTGVSARMALHFAKGDIGIDQPLVIESIIGTTFSGRVLKQVPYGPHQAIIPEVEGTSYITGKHEFLIDPCDPLKDGFILR